MAEPLIPDPAESAWRRPAGAPSLAEAHATISVAHQGIWRKLFAFSGPGLLVAVGYMDPGNWATDLTGGARFGYTLLSVILLSNLMAMLLQHLALRLGIVTGRDLAQACRDHYHPVVNYTLWVLCEIAIAACDLAEVIGSALALQMLAKQLLGVEFPLIWGVLLTVCDVMLVLVLQNKGFRRIEALVLGLMLTIGGCFAYEILIAQPSIRDVMIGLLPRTEIVTNQDMLYIAVGILGATVMPHNLYLHSSIVQTRAFERNDAGKRMAIKYATIDSTLSLFFAFFINAAILIVSAATFHGQLAVSDIKLDDAPLLLEKSLGNGLAGLVFAIALLASGQNSTLTGTMAGQIVMEGFLDLRLRPWVRRSLTRLVAVVPAVVMSLWYGKQGVNQLLILSQVILALQLGFAVVPLVQFTADRKKMGAFTIPLWMLLVSVGVALVIVGLDLVMLPNLWNDLKAGFAELTPQP